MPPNVAPTVIGWSDLDTASTRGAIQRSDAMLDEDLGVFGSFPWRVGDAFQGTQIFGGTGSGKTTGSGAAIACALLRSGFGGLVLTAKADDATRWRSYAARCGREADIVEITPHNGAAFNILDYEFRSGGNLTHNVVSLLVGAMTSGSDTTASEPYWNEALREMLIHTIDLAVLAGDAEPHLDSDHGTAARTLSLSDLDRIIRSAPQTAADVTSARWQRESYCWERLCQADMASRAGLLPSSRVADLTSTTSYWLQDFPNLSARTRSIIVSTFTAKVAGLLRWPLRELFFEGRDDRYSPQASMRSTANGRRGKIIIVNVPVKTYGEIGRLAQILYKIAWTRTADRRSGLFGSPVLPDGDASASTDSSLSSPVFLWADESQYFITPEDMLFQQTARSSRVATIYLTQNIGNYKAAIGRGNEASVYSLLGNLQTKIFHTNGDPATNKFAEETFGKDWLPVESRSVTSGDTIQDGKVSMSASRNSNQAMSYAEVVTTRDLTMLASGGTRYKKRIAALVFQAGRNWTSGQGAKSPPTNVFHHNFEQYLD